MAISRKITLTEKGANAGPVFALYYSLDCSTYTFQENVTLPTATSYVIVSLPDNTQCIKLISLGECTNEVIQTNPTVNTGDFYLLDFDYFDFNVF